MPDYARFAEIMPSINARWVKIMPDGIIMPDLGTMTTCTHGSSTVMQAKT